MWFYGWAPFTLGHHTTNFGGFRYFGSGNKMFLICHVIAKDHVFKGLCNYQTETAIFLAHEKTIMACSYLIFYKYFLHFELLASNTIKNESIHLNSWHHSHKKQKNSLETPGRIADIFAWTWNIWGGRTKNISKKQKMVVFVRNCLVKMNLGCFSEFLLLWLWCQHFWGSSED